MGVLWQAEQSPSNFINPPATSQELLTPVVAMVLTLCRNCCVGYRLPLEAVCERYVVD